MGEIGRDSVQKPLEPHALWSAEGGVVGKGESHGSDDVREVQAA